MIVVIVAMLFTVALSAAIVVCGQKRSWGYALAGVCGLTVSGFVAVMAVVADVDGDSGDARTAGGGLLAVLVISLVIATSGARTSPRLNSLWARHRPHNNHPTPSGRQTAAG